MELFISDLYSYLIDEMHSATNQLFESKLNLPKKPEKIAFVLDMNSVETLKRLANEAEIMHNNDLATKYYQERIAINGHDAELWYEYAVFALRTKHTTRAEECLIEAISWDAKHYERYLF